MSGLSLVILIFSSILQDLFIGPLFYTDISNQIGIVLTTEHIKYALSTPEKIVIEGMECKRF